jgi:WD40 repeat protein
MSDSFADQPGSTTATALAGHAIRARVENELASDGRAAQLPPPPSIPDHQLLHRIGTGAYGDVWLARSALGTFRAIKIIYRDRFDDERPYQREFSGILKYEPISRTHEGLIAVLHVGRNDDAGCFYYVMELADNAAPGTEQPEAPCSDKPEHPPLPYVPRTLRLDVARRQGLPPRDAAQLVLRLADALAHLHAHGLVHRDVKPSNAIFVGGQPKLADIGLVTVAGDSLSFVGTEGFIPPEGPGTPQADIFGLGKLLYELATGRDRLDFPQLPPDLPPLPEAEALLDLNEVITRACAPRPQERYPTAAQMRSDLALFLGGRSLRQAHKLEWHAIWFKRLALMTCAVLLLAGAAVWWSRTETTRARERERLAAQLAQAEALLRERAESAERESRQQLRLALLEQARALVRSRELGQRVRALDAIQRAGAISNSAELRAEAMAALSLPDLRFQSTIPLPGDPSAMEMDPVFERFAVANGSGPVEIRAAADGHLLASLPASADFNAYFLCWSPDGRFLASKRDRNQATERANLEVWDAGAARGVLLLEDVFIGGLAFHPHRPELLVGLLNGLAVIQNLETGTEVAHFRLPASPNQLAFSPDGNHFAAAYRSSSGWVVALYSAGDGSQLGSVSLSDLVASLQWSANGRWVSIADHSGAVQLLDSRTSKLHRLGRHKAQAVLTAFSPDSQYLLSGGWDRELICWDLRRMERAFQINLESSHAQFSLDGRKCAIMNRAGALLFDFESPCCRELPEDLGGRVTKPAAFSSDGRWLAVPGNERLGVWDLASSGPAALLSEAADSRVGFFNSGAELMADYRGRTMVWRMAPAAEPMAPPQAEPLAVKQVSMLNSATVVSNSLILTGSRGSALVAQNKLAEGPEAWAPTSRGVSAVSPDGRWLGIFQPFTPWLHLYSLPEFQEITVLTNGANILSFEFSPSNNELAIASPRRVEFWNTATWSRTRELTNSMATLFGPDGESCWLTKDYRNAGLYDIQAFELLLPLPQGTLPLALSPDSRWLAASVDARRVQVWDLTELRRQFRALGIGWAESATTGFPSQQANR